MNKGFLKGLSNTLRSRPAGKDNYPMKMLSEMAMPVVPHKNFAEKWEVLEQPRRLSRTYKFPNRRKLKYFVEELLGYEDEVNHHSKVTVDYETVSIEIYTLALNSITELDYEYAKMADLIYQDVEHYSDQ
mgnify:FL=1